MTSNDPRNWMWNEAIAMIERAEQLHRRFFEPTFPAIEAACWEPPVDMFENEREIWLITALPGVDPDNLRVTVEDDTILIAGQRRLPAAVQGAAIHRLEIPHGRFERRIRLPARALALDRSELANGCLTIHFIKPD